MDIDETEDKFRYEIITVDEAIINQELEVQALTNQTTAVDAPQILYECPIPATQTEVVYLQESPDWSEDKVHRLLKLYLSHVEEFRNPNSKKKDIWTRIGAEIGVDAINCDRKFRNLKQRYISLLKRGNKRQIARWQHYPVMVQIFKGDSNFVKLFGVHYKKYLQNEEKTEKKVEDDPQFERLAGNLSRNQVEISSKLDELIDRIKQSNVIQQKRNELFEKYIQTLQRR